ncbi:8321_t:CDS:1, partial [Diversispora eburnea]
RSSFTKVKKRTLAQAVFTPAIELTSAASMSATREEIEIEDVLILDDER